MPPPALLHHEFVHARGASPRRWAFLLHGIYGAGRNWNAVFRRLVERRPDWGVIPVDLRGHGQSPPMEPPHSLDACVADLDLLAGTLPLRPEAVIGHSFGGKVALLYGDDPAHGISQTWVVDSTPEARAPSGSAWGMLEVLRGSPGPFPTRAEGVQAVLEHGYARPVAQWMTTNLVPAGDDGFRWRLNPDQMETLLLDFFRTDAWDTVEHPHGPELHFMRATESSVLDEEGCHRLEAAGLSTGRVQVHHVEGGHWLNADNPGALVELMVEHLPPD